MLILAIDTTAVSVSAVVGLCSVVGAYIAIVPQLRKNNESAKTELLNGQRLVGEKVDAVEAHVTNGLNDAIVRLESMVSDIRATQEVSIHLDNRPMFRTTPHGSLLWANEAAILLLGMSLPMLQEDGWARAVHPDDAEMVFKSWKESVRTRQPWGPMFYRYRHPTTMVDTWVKAVAQPIINRRIDELEGWVATVIIVDGPTKEKS